MTKPEIARAHLSRHGKCKPQPATDWTGDFDLPSQLADFYQHVGPCDIVIGGHGNPFALPSLNALHKRQTGYRFDGRTGERFDIWPNEWIVIADWGADPFIFCDGRILYAMHGTGRWKAEPLFDDVNTMAVCLALIGDMVKDAGLDLTDEDDSIRPRYIEELASQYAGILGDRDRADSVLETLEWY